MSDAAWIAGASLFSGRPDPTWPLDDELAGRLESLWAMLGPSEREAPAAPPLGYRGSFLRGPGGREWLAFGGVVTLIAGGRSISRADPDGRFERLLLDSAPEGTLPRPLRP